MNHLLRRECMMINMRLMVIYIVGIILVREGLVDILVTMILRLLIVVIVGYLVILFMNT